MPIKHELRLVLLGQVELLIDRQPLTALTALKAKALFVYLAVTGTTHSRGSLAALLWSDVPEETARANLRTALYGLRKHLGDYLVTDRRTAAFDRSAPSWLDTAEFVSNCAGETFAAWETAVSLYHDDFLTDFYVPEAPLFEEWAVLEREHYRLLFLTTLGKLINVCLKTAAYPAGIQYARRLLRLDPLREEGHQQLMQLLAASGKRSLALAQYELCREILAEELGVSPSSETQQLNQQIKENKISWHPESNAAPGRQPAPPQSSPPTEPPPAHNLPVSTTAFIGRENELAQIADLLADPDCRLLTVLGPGGIGKTRLALAAARRAVHEQNGRFPDGVWFVDLTSVTDADSIAIAILQAMKISLSGKNLPHEELHRCLREKNLLLVLDNFEHVLGQANLLAEMLQTAAGVEFLITSRERLHLYEEWVLAVEGLPVPPENASQIDQFDAVRLFGQRARRINLQFDLAAEKTAVGHICQLVQGSPLAIELAAAWVHTLTCQDIIDQITRNIDFLASELKNIPARQRSLRATFAYSWALLETDEQSVFSKLTIFRGGFTVEAAEQVAGATLRHLSLLVDKSLVQRDTDGRCTIHNLLSKFGLEAVAAEARQTIETDHARYYARLVQQQEPHIARSAERGALILVQTDLENCRAAWNWAVDQITRNEASAAVVLAQCNPFLARFFHQRAWYKEGHQLFDAAVRRMAAAHWEDKPSPCFITQIQVQIRLAIFHFSLGNYEDSTRWLEHCLVQLNEGSYPQEEADATVWSGANYFRMGRFDEAESALHRSLKLFQTGENLVGEAAALNWLASLASSRGQYDEAMRYDRACLNIYRETGYERGQATCMNNIGSTFGRQGDHQQARPFYEEAISFARKFDDAFVLMVTLSNNGSNARDRGDYDQAESFYQESLTLARRLSERRWVAANLDGLGATYLGQGELKAAQKHLYEGLSSSLAIQSIQDTLNILASVAGLFVQKNQLDTAVEVLAVVLSHPSAPHWSVNKSQQLWNELRKGLPAELFTKASQTSRELDEKAAEFLKLLQPTIETG